MVAQQLAHRRAKSPPTALIGKRHGSDVTSPRFSSGDWFLFSCFCKTAPKGAMFLQLDELRLQQRPSILTSPKPSATSVPTLDLVNQVSDDGYDHYGCVSSLNSLLLRTHYRTFN